MPETLLVLAVKRRCSVPRASGPTTVWALPTSSGPTEVLLLGTADDD